jgi:hypothetical protein
MATPLLPSTGLRAADLPGVKNAEVNDFIRELRSNIHANVMPVCRRHFPGAIVASKFNPADVGIMLPRGISPYTMVWLATKSGRQGSALLPSGYENDLTIRQWGEHMFAFSPICTVAPHWDAWLEFLTAAVDLDFALSRISALRDDYNRTRRVIEQTTPELSYLASLVTRLIPEQGN